MFLWLIKLFYIILQSILIESYVIFYSRYNNVQIAIQLLHDGADPNVQVVIHNMKMIKCVVDTEYLCRIKTYQSFIWL